MAGKTGRGSTVIRISELVFGYVAIGTGFAVVGIILHVWTIARPTGNGLTPSPVVLSIVFGALAWVLITTGFKWHEAASDPPLSPERDSDQPPPLP